MVEVNMEGTLRRRAMVGMLLAERRDLLVVSGLGSASYDVMAAGDHDNNYYLWAAMGSAATVGLGLAGAQPEKSVLVVTGDGEALMGLGALATIACHRPANLTIAVLDNGHYGETGMQRSHTGKGISLARIAAASGFAWTSEIRHPDEVVDLRRRIYIGDGPKFATIKIEPETLPRILPSRDGPHIKTRFRAALGFQPK